MELDFFTNFLTLAKQKTFFSAARSLNINEEELRKQMEEIEKGYKIKLYYEVENQICLTKRGEYLEKQAYIILSRVEEVKRELKHRKGK